MEKNCFRWRCWSRLRRRKNSGVRQCSAGQNYLIGSRLHAEVSKVSRIMTAGVEVLSQQRQQVVVDQELHAEWRSGSSRLRTASTA